MQLLKVLYLVVFLGSIGYFFLYGFVMKKLPKITISYEEDYSVYHKGDFFQRIREKLPAEETKNTLSETPTTFSTLRASSRGISNDFDQDNYDDSDAVLNFLSNFKTKDALDDSNARDDETVSPPTRKPRHGYNGAIIPLYKLMKKIDELETVEVKEPLTFCIQPKRVGRLQIDKRPRKAPQLEEVQQELLFVAKGGSWKPKKCQATKKVAIVIPFRDRYSHLSMFLKHMHRFMRWQMLDYRIFVIEQSGKRPFNRGMLMNVGFQEAMKKEKYDCVIFHDVDLIPEDDRNDYSCPSSPRHMSTAVNTMKYKLGYKKIFGGVEAFWPDHFSKANGFPNRYWGWGGEDDDLYVRVMKASLGLTRPAQQIGRYYMMKHRKSKGNPERHAMLRESHVHIEKDGLNSLTYKVISETEHPLYTMIAVDITPSDNWSILG